MMESLSDTNRIPVLSSILFTKLTEKFFKCNKSMLHVKYVID